MYSIPTISQKPNRNQAMTQKERERERGFKKKKRKPQIKREGSRRNPEAGHVKNTCSQQQCRQSAIQN